MDEKVLLDVEINAVEALKAYSTLKNRIDELRGSQQELEAQGKQNTQVYAETEQKIKALSSRAREYQKTIQQNVKLEHEQAGSLQQMKAQLSLWTQEYNKLGEAERNNDAGIQIAINISELTKKLNDAEVELGNFHRQVGNYALASQALKKEMKDLANQLNVMKLNQEEGTEEYKRAVSRLAELKDATADVAKEVAGLADDTRSLTIASQSLGFLSTNLNTMKQITEDLNIGVPLLQESINKLNLVTTALSIATQLQTAAQKQSMIYQTAAQALQKIGIKQTEREAKAIAAKSAMLNANSLATKSVTAATWLWNKALAANPVFFIASAILAAIVAIVALTSAFSKSAKAQRAAEKASKAYEEQERKTAATLDDIAARRNQQINDINNSMRQEIVSMKQRGATEEEIAKYKLKREQEIRDIELGSCRERQVANEKLIRSKQNLIAKETDVLNSLRKGSKKYEEQKKKVDELVASLRDLQATQAEEIQKDKDILIKNIEAEQQAAEDRKKRQQKNAKDQADLQKQIADNSLKAQKQAEELALDAADASQADRFANAQKWEKKMFDANQAYEKRKLAQQRKNGELTQQEYNNQLARLADSERAFLEGQANNAKKEVLRQYKEVIAAVGQQTEQMLQKVDSNLAAGLSAVSNQLGIDQAFKDEYANLESLMAMYKQQEEEFSKYGTLAYNASGATMEADKKRFDEMQQKLFEYYRIEKELKAQAEEEKTAIEQEAVDKRLERALKAIENEDALALLDYTKTENEKTDILIEQSKKRIELYKKEAEAEQDPKVKLELLKKIAEEENNIRELTQQNILNNLNKELLDATLTAKKKYDVKMDYLAQELEAVKGNADAEAQINAEMVEARKEYLEGLSAEIGNWSGAALDSLNAINDAWNNIENGHLQKIEAENEEEKQKYKELLDSKLISQEQYDEKVAELDEKLDKKQKEIARKQAIRQKELNLMQTSIAAAQAIIMSLAQSPISYGPFPNPAGIASLSLATITGAAQIAAVAAQPLPKASRGALLQGPSHSQGGIPIEAEGGEAIINKRATSRYLPLLSAINESTGGVPLMANGGLVRQARQQVQQIIDYGMFAEAMSKVHINSQVAVTDINRGQSNYAKVESLRSF
ncbi:MAG: hypothetical protein KBS77_07330 [Bacteroidales bacterium]|nr:hypothetical protein [Candidatus Colicola faecequi]